MQQLASRGIQDSHLSIAPEASFFKKTYKRISNYAIEALDMSLDSIAWGQARQVNINRNGDLLTEMWLVLELELLELADPAEDGGNDKVFWTNCLGHAAITLASLDAGNSEVDRITGEWLEINHELTSQYDIDNSELVLRASSTAQLIDWSLNGNTSDTSGNDVVQLYVKLPFYFTKARSQALPTIALQYHDLKLKITLKAKDALTVYTSSANTTLHATNNGDIISGYVMCNFAFLDALERRLFAANSHEYLITNIQYSDYNTKAASATRVNCNLNMSHPCLAFYWYVLTAANLAQNQYFNWEMTPGRGDDGMTSAVIKFNSSEREKARGPLFFRQIIPSLYFPRTPRKNLYTYSFANHPNAWTPSGSVNLSRLDTVSIEITFRTTDADGTAYGAANIVIYALGFNIVRIQGGMLAKKYAN